MALALRLVAMYLRFSSPSTPSSFGLENFRDFDVYYVAWLHDLSTGLVPYRDFFYQYPPLFLYSLYVPYAVAGPTGVGLAIVTADSFSSLLIYLIAKQTTTRRVALVAGLGYAVNPFILLYEGYVLYSLEPVVAFLLLSVYLLKRGDLLPSAAVLAVAILFKQEALFVLPAYLFYARRFGLRSIAKSTAAFLGIVLAVSLPFLLTSPVQYFDSMAYRQAGLSIVQGAATASSNATAGAAGATCFYSQFLSSVAGSCIFNGSVSSFVTKVVPSNPVVFILNQAFGIALIPLALLTLPALYAARGRSSFLELSSSYSFAALVTAFAYLASYVPLEDVARYPYLPAYALLLVSGRSWRAPATALGFGAISLLLPQGLVQLALPFVAILAVIVVEDIGGGKSVAQETDANISSYASATVSSEKLSGNDPRGP